VYPTDPTTLRCFCTFIESSVLLPHNCPQVQVHELSAWLCIPQIQPPYVVFVHFQRLTPFSPTTAHRPKYTSFLLGCVSHSSNHPTLFLYTSRDYLHSPPQLPTGPSTRAVCLSGHPTHKCAAKPGSLPQPSIAGATQRSRQGRGAVSAAGHWGRAGEADYCVLRSTGQMSASRCQHSHQG